MCIVHVFLDYCYLIRAWAYGRATQMKSYNVQFMHMVLVVPIKITPRLRMMQLTPGLHSGHVVT